MHYCSSCGSPIPEGQGSSCSMCYGEIAHGKDGYYQRWAEAQEIERENALQREEDRREWETERMKGVKQDLDSSNDPDLW